MKQVLPIGLAAASAGAMLVQGSLTSEAAEKAAARKAPPKSDPDRPVVLGTVPNSEKKRVNKVDALTVKQKVQETTKKGVKAKGG